MAMRENTGKFKFPLDEAVWSLSLEGALTAECGSSSEAPGTWAGCIEDGEELAGVLASSRKEFPNIKQADIDFLRDKGDAGVIVTENSDGFVEVKYYQDLTDLRKDWKELEAELSVDDDELSPNNGATRYAAIGTYDDDHVARVIALGSTAEEARRIATGDHKASLVGVVGLSPARAAETYAGAPATKLVAIGNWVRGFAPNASREGNVGALTKMPLKKLRRHQDLIAQQIKLASRQSNTDALVELQARERELDQAIMQKEFACDSQTPNRRHRRNSTISDRRKAGVIEGLTKAEMDSMEIQIPDWGDTWKQVGGDMNPGAHGATIATADGQTITMYEIQPVREMVGDDEAKDVGFPFWTKEGTYDLSDLSLSDKSVQGAIEYSGLGEHLLEMTPEQRAVAIAEACMSAGHRSGESNAGFSGDILDSHIQVKWMSGETAGREYLADEDDEFRREILGERYEVLVDGEHESWFSEDDGEDEAIEHAETLSGHVQVKDSFDGEVMWDSNEPSDNEHTPNRAGYSSVTEIKRANKSAGYHFFDKGALEFFDSRIEPRVYGGRYFITSEQFSEDDPRLFSVRDADSNGRVRTIEQNIRSKSEAEETINALLRSHTPNTPRPTLEREGTLDQLIEMQAETLEPSGRGHVPREVKNALAVTEALRKVVGEYEAALEAALEDVVRRYPPKDGASAYDLFQDNAPYLVLMTLRGEGVGIWDGDWDSHYDSKTVDKVGDLLKEKLGGDRGYQSDAGSGRIEEALNDAVYEAMREAGYEFDDETYVKADDDDDEHTPNHAGTTRWHVFLNGELLEPVYLDSSYTAEEAKRYLIKAGYNSGITVDQPPARRTNLPPHYRRGEMRDNRKWTRAYMDELPDSAFLYVEPGGHKDGASKTVPRRLRHFPVRDIKGHVDLNHVRNALSRIPQSGVSASAKSAARAEAEALLARHGGSR